MYKTQKAVEIKHNRKLKKRAQELRKNSTPAERHLWYDFLRTYPKQFRRQVTIDRFILDFYCAQAKLAIEADGNQHREIKQLYDSERTAVLKRYGIKVLRFSNKEIEEQFDSVCGMIDDEIRKLTSITPDLKGE